MSLFMPSRLRELHTLKGKVESIAKLRGLDIDVNPHYTVWTMNSLRKKSASSETD